MKQESMEKILPTKQLYWLHTNMYVCVYIYIFYFFFSPLPKYYSDLPTTKVDLADRL